MAEKLLNDPINSTETIAQAQKDMRIGYANGSVGIIVSGLMWLISATVSHLYSTQNAVWTLLIGGTLIHPVSILLYKIMGLRGNHTKGNPLGNLAMEGTFFMILCLPLAYGLSLLHAEWFFEGMLLIIGGRYLTFSSLYGIRLYWILGAALAVAAYFLFYSKASSFGTLATGSLIEISFGIFMFVSFRKKKI
nr:hypothetical protein [uncultured Flavobacterium sp.]